LARIQFSQDRVGHLTAISRAPRRYMNACDAGGIGDDGGRIRKRVWLAYSWDATLYLGEPAGWSPRSFSNPGFWGCPQARAFW